MATETIYLRLEPTYRTWPHDDPPISGFKVVGTTRKPPSPRAQGVVVKLTLDVDDRAFKPLRPAALIQVGVEDVNVHVHLEPPDEQTEAPPGGAQ